MTAMRIGWGTKIAMLYGGFVLMMVALVMLASRQDSQLVAKDYYQQEIRYQEVIDAGKNQAALSVPVTYKLDEKEITISFPPEFANETLSGSIEFYAVAESKLDKKFELKPEGNQMVIARNEIKPSVYEARIRWESKGKEYYQETVLNLR